MELYYLLFLFVLNYFAVEALLRVDREAKCPQFTNFSGRIVYKRNRTRAVFKCPKFVRYGPRRADCQDNGTWSNKPPLCTKKGCLPLDQNLVSNLIMDVDVENEAVVKFSCDQDYHLIGETLAYCDGKNWSAPLPRCAATHEKTKCDFEEDLCGWTHDDWVRTLGSAQSGNTGPKYDHTYGDTGNGHFLFFETSNPSMTVHEAILYSPVYNEQLSPICFDFWYHILGPDEAGHVGSLEVFVSGESQYSDGNDIQPLFFKEGNQGYKWQRGEIFIDSQVESYQIVIVATRALNYTSDIAIDDVRLYNCSRKNETGQASTMAQTSTTTTHLIQKSTTTITQTTRGIKSTKAISTTNIRETDTALPTTVTFKEINPSFKHTTAIKKEAQSMSVSNISDLTKALPSIATTAMAQTINITRPSKTESSNTTTQTSSTSKLPTTEFTTITTQTSTKPSFSTARSITKASQTSTTPNLFRTESTIETTQTSTTPRPFKTDSTTFTKQTSATPRFSTTKSITTASQTSTTPNLSRTKFTIETTQTSTTPRPFKTDFTTFMKQTSATPRFLTTKSITTASQKSTTPNRSRTGSTTSTTQASTTLKLLTTMYTTTTSQTSSTSRPSSTTSVKKISTSRTDLPTKTSSTSSTMLTSVCCISSSTTTSSTLIATRKDLSTTRQASTDHMNDITGKEKVITISQNTNTEKTQTSTSGTTHVSKPTKRTNALTTKQSIISKKTRDNSISVSNERSEDIENEILTPLLIGLCFGMVAGSIIIFVIACVCVRSRKIDTSSYEGELKPMKNSDSVQSLNNGHCEEKENRTSANLENQNQMPQDANSISINLT